MTGGPELSVEDTEVAAASMILKCVAPSASNAAPEMR